MDHAGDTADRPAQGWYVDPFGIHEARWFSQGTPTGLVRDGRTEQQDPPPDTPIPGPLVPARAAPAPSRPSDDLLRGGDRGTTPESDPVDQFDFFGNPALPGTVGMAPAVPLGGPGGGLVVDPMDIGLSGPPTPARSLRVRWITLAAAVVWSAVVSVQLIGAPTTVGGGGGSGPVRTETVYRSDPGGVVLFIGLIAVTCVVTGIGFVRRARNGSEAWSRSGLVCTGVIGVLGVASLATVGLSLVVLAFLLFVVSRPMRRPRPIPGDRLV